ncbi:MAG TPA: hypothetical protein VNJ04_19650 [Gemmatimonadaceae bacterium]|nr:hypothetical protein [Gemmatimonadaceae bacterium]
MAAPDYPTPSYVTDHPKTENPADRALHDARAAQEIIGYLLQQRADLRKEIQDLAQVIAQIMEQLRTSVDS